MEQILKQVKSPFTDEFLSSLIEKYISCGCDYDILYKKINELGNNNEKIDDNLRAVMSKIHSRGIPRGEEYTKTDEEIKESYIYDNRRCWVEVLSETDPIKGDIWTKDKKKPLVYRIYLNLKGEDKANFIQNYIQTCRNEQIPFEFKFSKDNSRQDQIVILSSVENFEKNISIVETLTSGMQLGEVPELMGEYKEGIGISEEYYNRTKSPTQIRLKLIDSAVKKYLCDNIENLSEFLAEDDKKAIDSFIKVFDFQYEDAKEEVENFRRNLRKNYFQKRSSMECYKEKMESSSEAFMFGGDFKRLGPTIQRIYQSNPDKFMQEIIKNYRTIATEVWGLSSNLVFSSETEEQFLISENAETKLSVEQIGAELEGISRQGIVEGVQSGLLSIAEEKDENEEAKE